MDITAGCLPLPHLLAQGRGGGGGSEILLPRCRRGLCEISQQTPKAQCYISGTSHDL